MFFLPFYLFTFNSYSAFYRTQGKGKGDKVLFTF